MSGRKGKGPGDYEVGYRKPPKRTQFPRGRSGNPNGRPPGAKGKHKVQDAILQGARETFLAEGKRKITVRDGDNLVTMEAYALAVRATFMAAAKGSAMAQRTVIQTMIGTEAEIAEIMRNAFSTAVLYKERCELERRRCHNAGLPEPTFCPDPDDILVDWETLTVDVQGPSTTEQKQAFDAILAERDKYERSFANFRAEAEAKPRDWTLPALAKIVQDHFDAINDRLPQRYRKRLKNRMTPEEIDRATEGVRTSALKRKRRAARPKRRASAEDSDSPS